MTSRFASSDEVEKQEQHPVCRRYGKVALFDGHQTLTAVGWTELSYRDTDEINLCSMQGGPPPSPSPAPAATIEVVTILKGNACPLDALTVFNYSGGVYGWTKHMVYKGSKRDRADPRTASRSGSPVRFLTVHSARARIPRRHFLSTIATQVIDGYTYGLASVLDS